jgi:DNA replication and repair protein RecF
VIRWGSGEAFGIPPFARVRGAVARRAGPVEVEIGLQIDPARPGVVRKQIRLGGRPVRAMDAVGTLKAVLFSPEDVALVSGPPSGRRRYLDLLISQLDGAYLRALSRYARVLAQRNGLLKSLARERAAPHAPAVSAQLAFWDGELVALGAAIVARRWVAVRRLADLAAGRFRLLSASEDLTVRYVPSVSLEAGAIAEPGGVERVQPVVAREYEDQLQRVRADEIRRGASLVGPHRDDLAFAVGSGDLATFGSRGQQRLAVVALKLAETSLMTEEAGEAPVLLLDDVLSELDARHRLLVTSAAAEVDAQVFVTATDDDVLDRPDLAALPHVRLEGGAVRS